MTLTIADSQIAIKDYKDSLTFGNLSKPNGQSQAVKDLIITLLPYETEILALDSNTLIEDLSTDYKSTVESLETLLDSVNYELDVSGDPNQVNTIQLNQELTDFQFTLVNTVGNLLYLNIDIATIPQRLIDTIKVSNVVCLFDRQDTQIAKGIVRQIRTTEIVVEVADGTLSYSYAKINKWWSSRESVSLWTTEADDYFSPSEYNSFLDVKLYEGVQYLYSCVWTLYRTTTDDIKLNNLVEIAKGIDNIKPGFAYLSRSSAVFNPGLYHIKSKLIKYANYDTGRSTITWEITEPRRFIRNN